MTLIAGIDIGNATTEIVIADGARDPAQPIAWDRAPTRGIKGSAEASMGAARLLARLERRLGAHCDLAVLTPQRPVTTRRIDLEPRAVDTGLLRLLATGSATPAGLGHGVGRPVDIDESTTTASADEGTIILVARDPLGFRATVASVLRWQGAGHSIAGLLLAGDEAHLVSSRLGSALPIIDCVDAALALSCERIALEVAAPGQHVRALGDAIWLADALAVAPETHGHARAVCELTRGHRSAVIGRLQSSAQVATPAVEEASVVYGDGSRSTFGQAAARLAELPVGSVRGYRQPPADLVLADDLWIADLGLLGQIPGMRAGSVQARRLIVAVLEADRGAGDQFGAFTQAWPGEVAMLSTEAHAARTGALTTPGARPDALVVDLGGGTIDIVGAAEQAASAPGSGDLLTTAVARALSISAGAAEWVKRGPASRVDAPQIVTDESGERRFLDVTAPQGSVGWLVAPGPSGPLPFSRGLSVAEWRTIRITVKQMVFAGNVRRIMSNTHQFADPSDLIIVGGPAGDDEILETLAGVVPSAVLGRANVAGVLGHRWAVAYGLVLAGQARSSAMELPPSTTMH